MLKPFFFAPLRLCVRLFAKPNPLRAGAGFESPQPIGFHVGSPLHSSRARAPWNRVGGAVWFGWEGDGKGIGHLRGGASRPGGIGHHGVPQGTRLPEDPQVRPRVAGPGGWNAVDAFFARTRPEFVFLAAAKVGGIQANQT